MRKHLIALILSLGVCFCLGGCGDTSSSEASISETNSSLIESGKPEDSSSSNKTEELYTLRFAGLALEQIAAVKGDAIGTLPTVPEREGYTAVGWEIDGVAITAETVWAFTENKVADPVYTANTDTAYKIEFYMEDLNGQFSKTSEESMNGTTATTVSISSELLTSAAGTNYMFDNDNSGNVLEGTVAANGSLVLKAYFKLNTYTLTIELDGGTGLDFDTMEVKHGTSASTFTELASMVSKAGHTFSKWMYLVDGEYVDIPADATMTADMSIKAVWMKDTYTITWKNYDGTVLETDEGVEYGTMPSYDGATPTKETTASTTYTFIGWEEDVVSVAGSATYTAKFQENIRKYLVTFNTNEGDAMEAQEFAYGSETNALPEATKAGKTFLYWTLENGEALPETLTGEMTVKAVWGIGEAVTIQITDKEGFLAMGQGYHEKELKFVTYELATDLEFSNLEYTRVQTVVGDEQCVTWDRVAYVMESLNCTLDGKGHTIKVTYDKDVVAATGVVEAYPALFWTIGTNGVLKNVKIQAKTITNFETTSVARYNYGVVENCYVDAYHMYMHEATKIEGPVVIEWIRNATGEIVDNYGTVRNCVFAILSAYADGTIYTNTYAVRKTHEGGKVENCTVLGSTTSQFFSCDQYKSGASLGEATLTVGNVATYRTNCYVFASVADVMNGNGGMYNADGTITAGTYANIKDLYDGAYWETWGFTTKSSYTVKHMLQNVTGDGYTEIETETIESEMGATTNAEAKTYDGFGVGAFENVTVMAGGVTVVEIKYDRNVYELTIDLNGGTGIDTTMWVRHGTPASMLSEMPIVKDGYLLSGWVAIVEGVEVPVDTNAVVESPMTIKALWKIAAYQTLTINSKEDFLNMGKGYSEEDLKWITYELATDLEFANLEYTRVETVVGDGQCVNWDRVAYIMESLNCTLDGKGHTITVTYNKDFVATNGGGVVEAYPALFWTIGANGVLKNVKIVANTITNFETTSVARYNYGVVENCYVDAYHMYMHEATKVPGPDTKQWIRNATGEIVDNYGTVRNCVFKIYTAYADGTIYTNTYAVRKTHEGGKVENCTVLGSTTSQFFSCDQYKSGAFLGEATLTVGNVATYRTNCYVFANVDDLKAGNGGMYNADGSITAGTYAEVINLYDGAYWTAWFTPVEEA